MAKIEVTFTEDPSNPGVYNLVGRSNGNSATFTEVVVQADSILDTAVIKGQSGTLTACWIGSSSTNNPAPSLNSVSLATSLITVVYNGQANAWEALNVIVTDVSGPLHAIGDNQSGYQAFVCIQLVMLATLLVGYNLSSSLIAGCVLGVWATCTGLSLRSTTLTVTGEEELPNTSGSTTYSQTTKIIDIQTLC